MSVRIDADADGLSRTANLPVLNGGPYTWMAWVYFVTLPAAGDTYQTVFTLNTNASTNYDQGGALWNGSNARFFCASDNGAYAETIGATNLSATTWYHVAITRSSTTSLILYLNGVSQVSHTSNASTSTATRMDVGRHPSFSTDTLKGRVAAIKQWNGTALSATQILQEMYTIRPQLFTNLSIVSPTFPGSGERARDYSGNGRNWTEDGTLTDEDPPPVSWGAQVLIPPISTAVTLEQEGFRFRNDDGSETTATWRQTQDVNDSIARQTNFRLRLIVNATGDPPSRAYKLQYRKATVNAWRDVP